MFGFSRATTRTNAENAESNWDFGEKLFLVQGLVNVSRVLLPICVRVHMGSVLGWWWQNYKVKKPLMRIGRKSNL